MRAREARILREQDAMALLGSDAPSGILRQVLASRGWELEDWRLESLHHRPGAGVTGVYSVAVRPARRPRGRPDRLERAPAYACITSGSVALPSDGVAVVRRGAGDLAVWLHPADPLLPGLPLAVDAERATAFAFGPGHDPATTHLELRSYRPLRRAVVLAVNGEDRRYLKVVRRHGAAPLAAKHRMLRAAGVPAPLLAGEPVQDVVVTHPAPGTPLAELLMRDGAADVDPRRLVQVLTSLPPAVLSLPVRPPWAARVRDYGEGAAVALPARAARIRRLAAGIDDVVRSSDSGPLVPTHGDFYEGNLLITDGAVTGLLDVDALGPGRLVDDLACFLGHVAVLPGLHAGYARVPQALLRFLRVFDEHVDPAALRSRAAAVSLTLVAGARRRGTDDGGAAEALSRLEVAEQFLADAIALGPSGTAGRSGRR